ncbi:hypothetical protein ACQPYK_22365 [Streptosporangium sp. CA-135522]
MGSAVTGTLSQAMSLYGAPAVAALFPLAAAALAVVVRSGR